MPDPRVTKLAKVLVHYSVGLQPGDQLMIRTNPYADELSLAVYEEAIRSGAHVFVRGEIPGSLEAFYKYATDAQLDFVSPLDKFAMEHVNAILDLGAEFNTRRLSGADPQRLARSRKARAEIFKIFFDRTAKGELHWCYTEFPTHATAQEADMSLSDYQDFVYGAGLLDLDDPVAAWKAEGERQARLIDWLAGKDQVVIKGKDVDLKMSIQGRSFAQACGHENFPDGEIYTSPVETSANGWIRFAYPAIYMGQEVIDIELWFEDGKVVKEKAAKGQELLTRLLDSDNGSRFLGELGIGTNYGIQRFTKNMLFDEKIGGTIHLALGRGFPECGSQNESGLHWDMLCDMAESEIHVDGELFYKDGKTVV
jgi:aminopeptidase